MKEREIRRGIERHLLTVQEGIDAALQRMFEDSLANVAPAKVASELAAVQSELISSLASLPAERRVEVERQDIADGALVFVAWPLGEWQCPACESEDFTFVGRIKHGAARPLDDKDMVDGALLCSCEACAYTATVYQAHLKRIDQ